MNIDTSDHKPKATPAATAARLAKLRRHPGPVPDSDTAPESTALSTNSQITPPTSLGATSGYTFRTWTRLHKRDRRLDFSVAIAVSVAAHIGIALMGDEPAKTRVTSMPAAQPVAIEAIEMPEPEETVVDVEDIEPSETPPAQFAPPMQADLPSIVTVDSFVQPLQPPVASGISTDLDMMVVPTTVAVGQGGNVPKLFEITELDRVPNRIRTGMLTYPQEFRRSRKEGDVLLLVVIDPSGRCRVDKVLESSHPEFSRAAITAAEQSVYESPKKGGMAVSARYTLRVPFRMTTDG